MLAVARELNIALALDETWITRDGRFAASFEIDGDLAATPSEKGQVMQKIAQVVTRNGVWLRRMPNTLDFESRRQLRSLKAADASPYPPRSSRTSASNSSMRAWSLARAGAIWSSL